jgi:hypothetical protein
MTLEAHGQLASPDEKKKVSGLVHFTMESHYI